MKKDNYEEILANIEKLQKLENDLINGLDKSTSEYGYIGNQDKTLNRINDLSDARISMFKALDHIYNSMQKGVSNSRIDLVDQMTLVKVVEDQLTKAKKSIDKLRNRNDTKMRMVQINTYYGKHYEAHTELMKIIIIISIPLLILFILKNKGLLPEKISNYVIGITMAIGAIFVIRSLWDIHTRNKMNFDEYDWKYEDPAAQAPSIWQYNKENAFNFENPLKALIGNLGICVGSDCCAKGLTYDESKTQCVAAASVETFKSGGLINGSYINKDTVMDETDSDDISPYSSIETYERV